MQALRRIAFTDVDLTGGLWKDLMDINRTRTLPVQYEQCKNTGRLAALGLKWKKGCEKPHIFWDSDVAKWIEAAAYSLAAHPDKLLERRVDRAGQTASLHDGDASPRRLHADGRDDSRRSSDSV